MSLAMLISLFTVILLFLGSKDWKLRLKNVSVLSFMDVMLSFMYIYFTMGLYPTFMGFVMFLEWFYHSPCA